jgi:hypothetical protein
MELTEQDFEEEVKVEIDDEAFSSEELHCDKCNKNMEETLLDVALPNTQLSIHLKIFRCDKCGKEHLNGKQADKLDRALAVSRAIAKKGIVYERAGNFDGSNVFVRFPAQMIKDKEVKAEIIPISSTEFFVNFKKNNKNKNQ